LKNAREPARHNAFASLGVGSRAGIGMLTGRQSASFVGSAVLVIVGGRPTSDSLVSDPQPLRIRQAAATASS
jgi:hypothetical protein